MQPNISRKTLSGALACAFALAASPLAAANDQAKVASLADLTLEQLSNVTVTSVSMRAEPLASAAASIYVISREDIRRSAATSLAEALRLAPNLEVARADANQYAISARGGNAVLANRMLVLIDGRTVYSPLFSGTFWEAQDVMLEDVERIEVISGPGSALWGANAVNGVINVITRRAEDTQGVLASGETGTTQRDAAARYGGEMSGGHYRLYGKTVRRDNTSFANGTPIRDAAEHQQVGFRADWGKASDGFTLQGDAYGGQIDQAPQGRDIAGMNLLARWVRAMADGSSLRIQGYLDRTSRLQPGAIVEHLDTHDLDVQHALAPAGRHRLTWGFGLRVYRDRVQNSAAVAFLPPDRDLQRHQVFVQDEIALRHGLDLILGAKIEYNSYTGAEALPSARLAWHPDARRLVWAAYSRAVRAPSRIDREFFTPPPLGAAGGPGFQSETADVYELGYRAQPLSRLSYSITAYYNRLKSLRTLEPVPGGLVFLNDASGRSYGIETWANWRVSENFRLSAGYNHLHQVLRLQPGVVDFSAVTTARTDPSAWWSLRASLDLSPRHELDVFLRHYESLPGPPVPAYSTLDARLGWRLARDVELSFLVQNLLDRRHPEWGPPATRAEIDRAAFVKLRLGL